MTLQVLPHSIHQTIPSVATPQSWEIFGFFCDLGTRGLEVTSMMCFLLGEIHPGLNLPRNSGSFL